ncbi:hypothetical protein [Streptomyces chiangmaiensis]|uniref:Uncharacterized protein n=1 Tax=Streptomyces chiangmaiensis TaxID=766497 RepID=A0ABU7FB64_9ACTN|nr:hypothetical protein [Streptomyces chiangmaiensis]MED7821406.1 hypothetical protein [Streptomyces chiangmaiensis]
MKRLGVRDVIDVRRPAPVPSASGGQVREGVAEVMAEMSTNSSVASDVGPDVATVGDETALP